MVSGTDLNVNEGRTYQNVLLMMQERGGAAHWGTLILSEELKKKTKKKKIKKKKTSHRSAWDSAAILGQGNFLGFISTGLCCPLSR